MKKSKKPSGHQTPTQSRPVTEGSERIVAKRLSLEDANKRGLLKRFAKENPSKGDRDLFKRLLEAMAEPKTPSEDDRT
jgi:hypothetical protein